MAASSSRTQSNSSFYNNKPSSPFSSSSSSNSFKQSVNRSNGYGSRSDNLNNLNRTMSDSVYSSQGGGYGGGYGGGEYQSGDEIVDDVARQGGGAAGDSISVTIRFRPLSEREYQRGDEVAWYADGDKLVRNEYNPATSYAFDKVFGEYSETQEVYDVAAGPVIKAAMEGINGTVFAYGVTSSGKTHTMHGDHNSPGIIPLAIKDVFSIIQDTPGREFLLRVSYIEIYNESGDEIVDDVARVYAPRFPQRKKMMAIRGLLNLLWLLMGLVVISLRCISFVN